MATKQKSAEFTDREQSLIIEYMESHMSVLKGRLKGASKGGPNPKKELLASIAQQCTAMSLIPRTADSVLKKIENWELTTGKKRREERIEANKMGGGMNKLHNRSQSPTTIQLDHIAH